MKELWNEEPDLVEFEAFGYKCEVRRHERFKHLCGYVTVPENHPAHDKTYWDLMDVEVHGGLTFSNLGKHGFDCAHAGDYIPSFPDSINELMQEEDYRDIGYVIRETFKLAKQFMEMKK